jgi:hypothetical protein
MCSDWLTAILFRLGQTFMFTETTAACLGNRCPGNGGRCAGEINASRANTGQDSSRLRKFTGGEWTIRRLLDFSSRDSFIPFPMFRYPRTKPVGVAFSPLRARARNLLRPPNCGLERTRASSHRGFSPTLAEVPGGRFRTRLNAP